MRREWWRFMVAGVWIGMAGLSWILAPGPAWAVEEPAGLVVEAVAAASPPARGGLLAGDVLVSWSRTGGTAARGELRSPFDLAAVEIGEAPLGLVTLVGRRGGEARSWIVPAGRGWNLTVRPDLPAALAGRLEEARGKVAAGEGAAAEIFRGEAAAALARGDARLAGWLFWRLAVAWEAAGRGAEADAAFAAGVAALEGVDASAAGFLLREWGKARTARDDVPGAFEVFERALALERRRAPESLAEARTLHEMALAAARRRDRPAAEGYLREALARLERLAPESADLAAASASLGGLALQRNDFATAAAHLERAAALQERLEPGSQAHGGTVGNLGTLARRQGDLARAETFNRKALAIFSALDPESPFVASALGNLANVLVDRGDFAVAEEILERSLALQEKRGATPVDRSLILNTLGTAVERRGDLDLAERHFQQAVDLRLPVDPQGAAPYLRNLAVVAHLRLDFAKAATLAERALEVFEADDPGGFETARTLNLLGDLAVVRGDGLELAESRLRRALAILEEKAPRSLAVGDVLQTLGRLLAHRGARGEPAAGIPFLERAVELRAERVPGSTAEAMGLYFLGDAERRAGRADAAAGHLCRAADVLDGQRLRLGGSGSRSHFETSFSEIYTRCLAARFAQGRAREAFHVLERGRARAFLALLAERDLRLADLPADLATERRALALEYDRAQAELAGLEAGAAAGEVAAARDRLIGLAARQEELAVRFRRLSPRAAALEVPEPVDVGQARAALDPGTVLLAFAVGKEESHLFVLQSSAARGEGFASFRLPVGEEALERAVAALRDRVTDPGSDVAAWRAHGTRLYDLLLAPAEAQIARAERLLLLPDGPLHTLPWSALLRRGRPLGTVKPLHTALSATVYAELRRRRPDERFRGWGTVTAFGDPVYPEAGAAAPADPQVRTALARGADLGPLPATRAEVDGIAALFPAARIFVGEAATEERAKRLGPGARILHFACHGLLDESLPLNSGLALSLPENPRPGGENGLLQAWEIFEGPRLPADLVTLSACGTGLGGAQGGEGLIGLTRAFQYAGARTVVASLWSIADTSTGGLMRRFYRGLARGLDKAEALRRAQKETAGSEGPGAHPYHWAAFLVFGDFR